MQKTTVEGFPEPSTTGPSDGANVSFVGGVELHRLLGEGGVGQVYLGWHTRLNILVAVKILKQDCIGNHATFVREARLTARIEHPNLIRIFDVGHCANTNTAYIIMEYVPGFTAFELLRRQLQAGCALTETSVLRLALMTAQALSAAHAKSIVHRDVKPDNILVRSSDGTVKLTDLGLAWFYKDDTACEFIEGTWGFVAPEVIVDQEITPANDVYALGATIFELLTGGLPYGLPLNESYGTRQLAAPAPDIRKFRPELSGSVASLVARCLAQRPQDRYANAGQLASAIETVLGELEPGARLQSKPPTRQIICIDDDPDVLELINDVLQPEGYKTHCFASAEMALMSLGEITPDVAVVDMSLPGLNGLQFARELWRVHADCPVLILSGRNDASSIDSALSEGVADYLVKPLRFTDLLHRIKLLCRSLDMRQEQQRVCQQLQNMRRKPSESVPQRLKNNAAQPTVW